MFYWVTKQQSGQITEAENVKYVKQINCHEYTSLKRKTQYHVMLAQIHVITVSNEVRSAAVNKMVGVKFNVIKVICILFFRTTSIRTKI